MKITNTSKYIFGIIAIIIIVAGYFGFNYYVNYKDEKNLERLIAASPNGQALKEKIAKATADLKDKDTENDFFAYTSIGLYKYDLGDYRGAEKAYLQALKIRNTDNLALWNLSTVLEFEKKYEEETQVLQRLISLDPYLIRAYIRLADVYRYNLKNDEQMLAVLRKGLESNLENADILSYLANYYKDLGQKDQAINYFSRLVKISPENKTAQEELNQLLAK